MDRPIGEERRRGKDGEDGGCIMEERYLIQIGKEDAQDKGADLFPNSKPEDVIKENK